LVDLRSVSTVIITGVAGFIGAHVARRFMAEGRQVVGVDDLSSGREQNIPAGIDFVRGDLARPETIQRLPRGCRAILHLAGQSSGEISFDDPVADLSKNVVSTLNLIRHGIDSGVERILYASSMSVYGHVPDRPIDENEQLQPLSCYGVGKRAAEGYLAVYARQLPYVALRMFNVYGPGQDLQNLRQGMVSIYVAQALAGGRIEVKGSTDRFRDFIYIDDVVEAWWRAANQRELTNTALNVGTGRRTSVGQLLEKVCAAVPGSEYSVRGATPGDQTGIYADASRLRTVLGIDRCTPLEDGLERFVGWARNSFSAAS
jgi:UDP-glucose 4-epimerase